MVDTPDAGSVDNGLPRWFTVNRSAVDVITGGLNDVGTLLIIVIMLLVNVLVSGVPEMVSMSIFAIVFLQIAQTFRKGCLTGPRRF